MSRVVTARSGGSAEAATFTDVLRSEWVKFRTLRSAAFTVLAAALLGIGFGALLSLAAGRRYEEMSAADWLDFDPVATSLGGHFVAQLAIGVLGILAVTSEYATGMIHTSLTVVPRRGRVLAAKAVVPTAVALVVGAFVGFGAFLVGQAVLSRQGVPHAGLGQPHVLRALVGAGLYLAMVGLLGVAVGTLVRATAGALAIIVGITFLVPAFLPVFPESWARVIGTYWPTLAGKQIMTVRSDSVALGPWTGFGLLCATVAAVVVAAAVVFRTRDA